MEGDSRALMECIVESRSEYGIVQKGFRKKETIRPFLFHFVMWDTILFSFYTVHHCWFSLLCDPKLGPFRCPNLVSCCPRSGFTPYRAPFSCPHRVVALQCKQQQFFATQKFRSVTYYFWKRWMRWYKKCAGKLLQGRNRTAAFHCDRWIDFPRQCPYS